MDARKAAYLLLPLVFLLTGCLSEPETDSAEIVRVDDKCPAFSVLTSDGKTISDLSLRGTKSMIVFFNTSCPDCRNELPIIQSAADKMPEVKTICIARSEQESSIARFWEENGLTLTYSPQPDNHIYSLFARRGIPRIYILSEDGFITHTFGDNQLPSLHILLEVLGN